MQLKKESTDRPVSIPWIRYQVSAQLLIPNIFTTVPRRDVLFGNTAGLGPELDYDDPEMLRNATRMREIHRNWHSLFPRKLFQVEHRYLDSATDIFSFPSHSGSRLYHCFGK